MDDELEAPRRSVAPWAGGAVLVALLGAGGYAFIQAMAPTYVPGDLLERGIELPAEIISAQKTGESYEGEPVYELELQVRSDSGRGHRAFHKQPFAVSDAPKLVKTTPVRVKVDPQDKRRLWVTELAVEPPPE